MLNDVSSAEEDQRVLLLLMQGNQESISLLYNKYAPALFGIICRITNNKQLAEGILQTVFLKAWNQRDASNSSGLSVFTWLINMARQAAFDAMKLAPVKNLSGSNTVYKEPDNVVVKDSAFNLVYYKGLSFTEVAAALNLSVSAVTANIRMNIQNRQEKKVEA